VLVNVALIDCRNNRRVWTERYDRTLADTLTLQGELAQEIASALRATLTPEERTRVETKPTNNADAYEAYLRGLAHEGHFSSSAEEFKTRISAYEKAVELDPLFAVAWAALSRARVDFYFDYEHTPRLLAEAKRALDAAMELAPDLGEVLSALGRYRYWGTGDYDDAVKAYTRALQRLPNNAAIVVTLGNVKRRQGKWEEALALQTQATQLDPRNNNTWISCGITLHTLRRYDEALAAFNHGLEAAPGDTELLAKKIFTYQAMGDLDAAERVADLLRDSENVNASEACLRQWFYRRNYEAALAALKRTLARRNTLTAHDLGDTLNLLGTVELWKGERETGLAHLTEGRAVIETLKKQGDDNFQNDIELADACGLLGDTAAALHHAEQAVAAVARDAFSLHTAEAALARARMRAGDNDSTITILKHLLETPSSLSPALLKLHPFWDPLRNDPRFQKLLTSPEPKTT
jgi:tetratricopeptide (TPR) repeat protein